MKNKKYKTPSWFIPSKKTIDVTNTPEKIENKKEDINKFDVNTCSIWQHYHKQFINDAPYSSVLSDLVKKLEEIILKNFETGNEFVEPFATKPIIITDYQLNKYYEKTKNTYLKYIFEDHKTRFMFCDYFDSKFGFFEFNQNITIEFNNPDFEYFFALFINTYEYKLEDISELIDFTFKRAKRKNKNLRFDTFSNKIVYALDLYKDLLDNSVIKYCELWITNEKNKIRMKNQDNTPESELRTYPIAKIINKKLSAIEKGDFRIHMKEVYNRLFKGVLIDNNIEFEEFFKIFAENELEKKIKIHLSFYELKYFILKLMETKEIVAFENASDKWKIATFCFEKIQKGNIKPLIYYSQISAAYKDKSENLLKINEFFDEFKKLLN